MRISAWSSSASIPGMFFFIIYLWSYWHVLLDKMGAKMQGSIYGCICCIMLSYPERKRSSMKIRCLSPETSPALKWPVPEPWPEECDTSRYTDAPETWSLWSDHSSLRCTWTSDPAAGHADTRVRWDAQSRLRAHGSFPQLRRLPAFCGCGFSPDFGPFLPPQPARVPAVSPPSLVAPHVFTNNKLYPLKPGWSAPPQCFFDLKTGPDIN